MKERRPLVAGIRDTGGIDPRIEKDFIFGAKGGETEKPMPAVASTPPSEARDSKGKAPISRVGLTTRLRADFTAALKRESLERQLNDQFPNSLQEILEEALEPWMREKGYLK